MYHTPLLSIAQAVSNMLETTRLGVMWKTLTSRQLIDTLGGVHTWSKWWCFATSELPASEDLTLNLPMTPFLNTLERLETHVEPRNWSWQDTTGRRRAAGGTTGHRECGGGWIHVKVWRPTLGVKC